MEQRCGSGESNALIGQFDEARQELATTQQLLDRVTEVTAATNDDHQDYASELSRQAARRSRAPAGSGR